jgi:hypothetical protein
VTKHSMVYYIFMYLLLHKLLLFITLDTAEVPPMKLSIAYRIFM